MSSKIICLSPAFLSLGFFPLRGIHLRGPALFEELRSLAKSRMSTDLSDCWCSAAAGRYMAITALAHLPHLSVDLCDLRALEKQAHRVPPKRDDDARVDDLDLALEIIAGTGMYLVRQRSRLPGGRHLTTFVIQTLGAGHACLFEQLIQELSRRRRGGPTRPRGRPVLPPNMISACAGPSPDGLCA